MSRSDILGYIIDYFIKRASPCRAPDHDPTFATRLAKVRLKKLFFGDSFNTNFNPQGVTLIRHNNIVTCRYATP